MTIRRAYLTDSSMRTSNPIPAVQAAEEPPVLSERVPPDAATRNMPAALASVVTDELERPPVAPEVSAAERSVSMDDAKATGGAILGELVTCMNGFAAYWESDASGKRRFCVEEATGEPPCKQKAHDAITVTMKRSQGAPDREQTITIFLVPTLIGEPEIETPAASTAALDEGPAGPVGSGESMEAVTATEEKP